VSNNQLNITEPELALIDEYITGKLSLPEKEAFEERLQKEPEWKQKVEEVKLLSLGIQEAALRQKLETFHTHQPVKVREISWLRRLSAAAVFIGLIGLCWWIFIKPSAEEKLYAGFYKPDAGLATEMSVSENYNFERAMVDYKTGKYSAAIDSWKKLLGENPTNDTLNYFIGSAYIANKDAASAINYFDAVLKTGLPAFASESHWYKGLALIRIGKKEEAIVAINASSHPQKAALLRKLQK
jgi:tetratricopeptide (TPR) repeat protein